MDYDKVIDELIGWADEDPNIRAIVMTGSGAARRTHRLSDRDLEIYLADSAPLLTDDSWWDRLGEVLVVERLHSSGWHPSRLVYYAGGKLDLTIIDVTAAGTVSHGGRPFTVLIDKDNIAESFAEETIGAAHPTPQHSTNA